MLLPVILHVAFLALPVSLALQSNDGNAHEVQATPAKANRAVHRIHKKPYAQRKEVQSFIKHMVQTHQFNQDQLVSLFKSITPNEKALSLMDRQYEKLPWFQYKTSLITEQRIKEGVDFWNKHAVWLKKAEQSYGVPAQIIVAIIGMETFYGKILGKHPVFQTLATLAFDYPRRAAFFKQELEQFLLLTKEEGFDPSVLLGSFSGAMGTAQFMPSNYRRFAIDFENKGQRDLINNPADAIGSVANYFKHHGWQAGAPVAQVAQVKNHGAVVALHTQNGKPEKSVAEFSRLGVQAKNVNPKHQASLVALQNKDGVEHWLCLSNFYVITRYNHSIHYAMAVYHLSQAIYDAKTNKL